MKGKRFTAEQIVNKLRQAEVELSQGQALSQITKGLGITEQTYYRWRKEYGGLRMDQAKRLKQLEQENGRLRKVVADLTLDNAMLKEVADPNFFRRPGGGRRRSSCGRSSTYPSGGRAACCVSRARRSADDCTHPTTSD